MGGAALRNWQNINIMMKFGSVAIFSITKSSAKHNGQSPPGVALWCNNTVSSKPPLWKKVQRRLLPSLPFKDQDLFERLYKDSISKKLDHILLEFQPDLVIFEELWLYRYFPIVKNRGCRIILDEHNVELSLYRETKLSNKKTSAIQKIFNFESETKYSEKIRLIESKFIHQADQVWACSEADANSIRRLYGCSHPIRVIPNCIDVSHYACVQSDKNFSLNHLESKVLKLVFTGNFGYLPNQIAAQLLIDKIFPKLQVEYPSSRLFLAGNKPTLAMQEAAKLNPNIITTGFVQDIRLYLSSASVVIVPLFQGGGTRLKILEAFAARRPVVSTSKGAEGLKVQDGKHLLIKDNIDELVAGVVELWQNPSLRQMLTDNAYQVVKEKYSWEAASVKLTECIQDMSLA